MKKVGVDHEGNIGGNISDSDDMLLFGHGL